MQCGVRVLLASDESEVGAVLAVRPHVVCSAVEMLRAAQECCSRGLLVDAHAIDDQSVFSAVVAVDCVLREVVERVILTSMHASSLLLLLLPCAGRCVCSEAGEWLEGMVGFTPVDACSFDGGALLVGPEGMRCHGVAEDGGVVEVTAGEPGGRW